ncbi:HlyD family secretion protein [Sulfuricurvum sp.]|uniref:HlyD family secretion protein n=1 Tax=Sulfuricurvum sp. TaxID=2025608 RepID=UPI003BAF0F2A
MKQFIEKYQLSIVIAILFIAATVLIYKKLHPYKLPENLVQGSGRIDGDLININAKYPGRISKIEVEDGQSVKKDEILATQESREQTAQLAQIEAQIEAQKQQLSARTIELNIAKKTIPESLVKADAGIVIKQRQRDELDQMINTQANAVDQDQRDMARMENLYANRLIEKHKLEMAMLKLQNDQDQLSSLKQKRLQLDQAIGISRSDRSDASASQAKIAALQEGIKVLESGVKGLIASKQQIEAVLSEMELRSPVNGLVIEKIANEGEVVGAGMPVVTLIDPSTLYLKIFIDTLQNGKIKIGDSAVIFLDSYPKRPIRAKVVRIEQKAEFTPKEVSVPSDRIQRVYAVHLKPLKSDELLKLGIPAVGVISLDGENLPTTLSEVPE